MVKYSYNFFKKYNNFDIVPYQEAVDSYLETQDFLLKTYENYGGDNLRPINSDKEKIDKNGFWSGFPPAYFNLSLTGKEPVNVKADVVSMDMAGLNSEWDHFAYFEIPFQIFKQYQKSVHSNSDISIFKVFMHECIEKNLDEDSIINLAKDYDKKYPEKKDIQTYFRKYQDYKWRTDLVVDQFISIKKNGLIYPICFNYHKGIFERGTHRAIMLAYTNSKVPIFIRYPQLGKGKLKRKWKIKLSNNFGEGDMYFIPDLKEKKLTFYKGNEKISSFNSRS